MKPILPEMLNRFIMLDVESNGPIIGHHSMISYGLVSVGNPEINHYQELAPISDHYVPEALAISGFEFEETQAFQSPESAVNKTLAWLKELKHNLGDAPLILWSDNPGYDFGWLNYYLLRYGGVNPFGHSCRSVPELWCGQRGNIRDRKGWRKFKRTKHTHNALDDAKGNAEALAHILQMKSLP